MTYSRILPEYETVMKKLQCVGHNDCTTRLELFIRRCGANRGNNLMRVKVALFTNAQAKSCRHLSHTHVALPGILKYNSKAPTFRKTVNVILRQSFLLLFLTLKFKLKKYFQ